MSQSQQTQVSQPTTNDGRAAEFRAAADLYMREYRRAQRARGRAATAKAGGWTHLLASLAMLLTRRRTRLS